jgi:2-isopropylmalate synthase
MDNPDRVLIVDRTLQRGRKAFRGYIPLKRKLHVARALAELGVDVLDVGLPVADSDDWCGIAAVAREVHGPIIASLTSCNRKDIELTAKALRDAPRRRINVVLAVALGRSRHNVSLAAEKIIRSAETGIHIARELCDDVEFSAVNISPMEWDLLAQVVEAAIEHGAATVNIADTRGCIVPDEFTELIRYLRKNVRGIHTIRLSVQCCDSLGVALANSLAAVMAGARQVECAMKGLGGRGGGCGPEELIVALRTREAFFNVTTGIYTNRLYPTAQLVSSITGVPTVRHL